EKHFSWRLGLLCLGLIVVGTAVKLNALMLLAPLIVATLFTASRRTIVLMVGTSTVAVCTMIVSLQRFSTTLLPFFYRSADDEAALRVLWKHFLDQGGLVFLVKPLPYTFESTFGLFGWGNIELPQWLQRAWGVAASLATVGLIVVLVRQRSRRLLLVVLFSV